AEGTFFRVLKLVSVGDRAAWGWLGFASSRNKRALHDLVGSVVYKSLRRVASASVRLPSREVKEGWERAEARLRRAQLRVAWFRRNAFPSSSLSEVWHGRLAPRYEMVMGGHFCVVRRLSAVLASEFCLLAEPLRAGCVSSGLCDPRVLKKGGI